MLAPVDYKIYNFDFSVARQMNERSSRECWDFRFADGICVPAICAHADSTVDNDSLIR